MTAATSGHVGYKTRPQFSYFISQATNQLAEKSEEKKKGFQPCGPSEDIIGRGPVNAKLIK